LRSNAAVYGASVELGDLNIDVMFQRFFDVGVAEVIVIFHRRYGTAAGAVDTGEESESKTNVLSRQCVAMVPLAFDIGCVLN